MGLLSGWVELVVAERYAARVDLPEFLSPVVVVVVVVSIYISSLVFVPD